MDLRLYSIQFTFSFYSSAGPEVVPSQTYDYAELNSFAELAGNVSSMPTSGEVGSSVSACKRSDNADPMVSKRSGLKQRSEESGTL